MAEEYCWAITWSAWRSYSGRSSFGVRSGLFWDITRLIVVIPLPTFRDNLSDWSWNTVECPETFLMNYHYTLRNIPEERRPHLFTVGNLNSRNFRCAGIWFWTVLACVCIYRGADKSLTWPGRKQARNHVRDARDFNNIETRAVIKYFLQSKPPKEIHAILTETFACFLPCQAKDLSALLYISVFV